MNTPKIIKPKTGLYTHADIRCECGAINQMEFESPKIDKPTKGTFDCGNCKSKLDLVCAKIEGVHQYQLACSMKEPSSKLQALKKQALQMASRVNMNEVKRDGNRG